MKILNRHRVALGIGISDFINTAASYILNLKSLIFAEPAAPAKNAAGQSPGRVPMYLIPSPQSPVSGLQPLAPNPHVISHEPGIELTF